MTKTTILKHSFIFFLACLAIVSTSLHASTQLLIPSSVVFKPDDSYVLFNLESHGVAPSIKLVELKTRKGVVVVPNKSQQKLNKSRNKYISIPLKGLENGIYMLKLKPGVYQITELNSPAFNLAYQLSTDYSPAWRFEVFENSVSYAGTLYIPPERSKRYVDFQLKNHFATDLAQIKIALQSMSASHQLRLGKHPKDNFYKHYLAAQEL